MADPDAIQAPFFLFVPPWAQLPIVLLATAATVIASQAVITARSPSPAKRSSSDTCPACGSSTSPSRPSDRSTCPTSTGR